MTQLLRKNRPLIHIVCVGGDTHSTLNLEKHQLKCDILFFCSIKQNRVLTTVEPDVFLFHIVTHFNKLLMGGLKVTVEVYLPRRKISLRL